MYRLTDRLRSESFIVCNYLFQIVHIKYYNKSKLPNGIIGTHAQIVNRYLYWHTAQQSEVVYLFPPFLNYNFTIHN